MKMPTPRGPVSSILMDILATAPQHHVPELTLSRYPADTLPEDKARELQLRAREAEEEAQRLRAKADDATDVAREHRDRVTGEYLKADEIDPDTKR